MSMTSLMITPSQPFHFDHVLDYLCKSNSTILEKLNEQQYSRVFIFEDAPCLITLANAGNEQGQLNLVIQGDNVSESVVSEACAKIRKIFGMDKDYQAFTSAVSEDPVFSSIVSTYSGLRPILLAEPYEALLWAIIGQQVNTSFAKKLKQKLIELCECKVTFDGDEYGYLPRPEQIAELDISTLKANQFSSQKATYLAAVSKAIVSGQLNLNDLSSMTVPEAMTYLTSFRGIGRWTAECILMRGIGFDDIIPAGDVGLQTITAKYYGLGIENKLQEPDLRVLSNQWKPWRSWAAFLWWHHLQQSIQKLQKVKERDHE